jgi:hypothetical protein
MSIHDRDWYREELRRREAAYSPKQFREPSAQPPCRPEEPAFTLPDPERQAPRKQWPVWFAVLVWGLITLLFFSFAHWLTKR